MSCLKIVVFCVTLYIMIEISISVECKTPGRYCIDHKDCCGGCCRNEVCIKTYDLCTLQEDPCLNRNCPPGMECQIFQPNCEGCEAITYCDVASNL